MNSRHWEQQRMLSHVTIRRKTKAAGFTKAALKNINSSKYKD